MACLSLHCGRQRRAAHPSRRLLQPTLPESTSLKVSSITNLWPSSALPCFVDQNPVGLPVADCCNSSSGMTANISSASNQFSVLPTAMGWDLIGGNSLTRHCSISSNRTGTLLLASSQHLPWMDPVSSHGHVTASNHGWFGPMHAAPDLTGAAGGFVLAPSLSQTCLTADQDSRAQLPGHPSLSPATVMAQDQKQKQQLAWPAEVAAPGVGICSAPTITFHSSQGHQQQLRLQQQQLEPVLLLQQQLQQLHFSCGHVS